MNFKLGIKESSSLLFFMCLPQLLLFYINEGLNRSDSGFIISFLICSAIAFVLMLLSKKYLGNFNEKSGKIINFIFLLYIIPVALYNLSLCLNALMSVCGDKITPDVLLLLILLTAGCGAYLGAEALSRCALVSFLMSIAIFAFIYFISFDGWETDNLYPLLGINPESTFLSFDAIGIYSGLISVFALKNNITDNGAYKALKRGFLSIFIIGASAVFLCIVTIPYPLGSLYDFSLAGIFSTVRSGSFFHRFEIILIFLLIIITYNSLSFSMYISSLTLSRLGSTNDTRPYVILMGAFLFFAMFKKIIPDFSFIISNIFACFLAVIFIAMRKRQKAVRKL